LQLDVERQPAVSVRSLALAPSPAAGRVALLCSEVLQHGVLALLPAGWRERAEMVADLHGLERLMNNSCMGAILDAEHPDALRAARLTRAHGAPLVVLAASAADARAPWMLEHADAILIRDEVSQAMLRIALAAVRVGMRLVPRGVTAAPGGALEAPPLADDARRVLTLLAEGQRDAEMARNLGLSESAVRKLVQRTVHAIGARTRCEAVVIASRNGQLS
jgi:DNA-binding NarL/FixJ family response regulator